MRYLSKLKETYNTDQLIILTMILAMIFPFYICIPIYLVIFTYLLYTKKAITAFKNTPKIKILFLFLIVFAIVSLNYQNWIVILVCGCLFVAMTLVIYYRDHIDKDLFEKIIDILIVLSIFWAIYGLYEQMMIYQRLGGDIFSLKVYSRRENRLNSVFFNANYYGMMLEFIVMLIIYKISMTKDFKRNIFYILVFLLNLFMIYMSGCRTALIAIAGAILIFLILNKNYKICSVIGLGVIGALIFFIINPEHFPRIERIVSNFDVRMKIWKCAIEGIKHHPLFGQGPFTYMMIRDLYNGHLTEHAHSVYLDPLLSFGVVGLSILVPYVFDRLKRLWSIFKEQRTYVALVVSFIVVVLLHGIFDYTILWIHTLLLFGFVVSSYPMFKADQK